MKIKASTILKPHQFYLYSESDLDRSYIFQWATDLADGTNVPEDHDLHEQISELVPIAKDMCGTLSVRGKL